MVNTDLIKGIIFDYGGTIDSNGKHWAEVLWDAYRELKIPVTKEQFREAYVYGERYLATNHVIKPEDNFFVLLQKKTELQLNYLVNKGFLTEKDKSKEYNLAISDQCYTFVRNLIAGEIPLLTALKRCYPVVLVSNFYGNVESVLADFGLLGCFDAIVESAVVGIRKPDPAIFALGVEKTGCQGSEVVVIGDSYSKDIVPASANGCQTIWLKGPGWGDEEEDATADQIISDFMELKQIFRLE